MQPIDQIYRDRLRRLVEQEAGGSQAKLAGLIGKSPAQISQWLNASKDSKTGKPRAMDRSTAREIERKLGKPEGWMDRPLYESQLEREFATYVAHEGIPTYKVERDDAEKLPEWLKEARVVPDFWVQRPGSTEPLWVEIKATREDARPEHNALEMIHPDQFAVIVAEDFRTLGTLKEVLRGRRREAATPADTPQFSRPAPEARAAAAAPSMQPILAWQHETDLPEGEYVMVPRLEVHLSAGNGAGKSQVEIDFNEAQPQAFRADWIRQQQLKPKRLAALTARGDSMEPSIFDGDSLLVDTSQTEVIDKKVYALWYEGGERVKRLFRMPGGGLRIKSDNSAEYPEIILGPDYAGQVRVIGRVVHRSGTGGL